MSCLYFFITSVVHIAHALYISHYYQGKHHSVPQASSTPSTCVWARAGAGRLRARSACPGRCSPASYRGTSYQGSCPCRRERGPKSYPKTVNFILCQFPCLPVEDEELHRAHGTAAAAALGAGPHAWPPPGLECPAVLGHTASPCLCPRPHTSEVLLCLKLASFSSSSCVLPEFLLLLIKAVRAKSSYAPRRNAELSLERVGFL